jgi:dephospho-CoA kinase
MLIIGLTGSIAMGKSATANMFRDLGIGVFDADAEVHKLYAKGGEAVPLIEAAFPGVTRDGAIDRTLLAGRVLGNPEALRKLEAIVHPLVREREKRFMAEQAAAGARMVVLDIPLLFESGPGDRVDYVVVVSAPAEVQRERAMARPGMTAEKFEAILAKQMPDEEKRRRADFVVDTSQGFDHALEQVKEIVSKLEALPKRLAG